MKVLSTKQINEICPKIKNTLNSDSGFCIECGIDIRRYSRSTLFCGACSSDSGHMGTHSIVYSLYQEIDRLQKEIKRISK